MIQFDPQTGNLIAGQPMARIGDRIIAHLAGTSAGVEPPEVPGNGIAFPFRVGGNEGWALFIFEGVAPEATDGDEVREAGDEAPEAAQSSDIGPERQALAPIGD